MKGKNFYTVWDWYEAPYAIRAASPIEDGTWIVRVEPGYGFPHHKIHISEHHEWKVEVSQIDGRWYTFIKVEQGHAYWTPFNTDWLEYRDEWPSHNID